MRESIKEVHDLDMMCSGFQGQEFLFNGEKIVGKCYKSQNKCRVRDVKLNILGKE